MSDDVVQGFLGNAVQFGGLLFRERHLFVHQQLRLQAHMPFHGLEPLLKRAGQSLVLQDGRPQGMDEQPHLAQRLLSLHGIRQAQVGSVWEERIMELRELALDTEAGAEVFEDPNRNADLAIFVISRTEAP